MTLQVVDERWNVMGNQGYRYDRTYRDEAFNKVVRVRVLRDFYRQQSHALAEVLSADLNWVKLVDEAPESWWDDTPTIKDPASELKTITDLADRLARRAANVLGLGVGSS